MRPKLPKDFSYAFCVCNDAARVFVHRDGRGYWQEKHSTYPWDKTLLRLREGQRHIDERGSIRLYTRLTDTLFRPSIYAKEDLHDRV